VLQIELYTSPGCGYCTHAKRLLTGKKIKFVEYNVYENPEYLTKMQARTLGRTFPQVFIGNVAIGGFTELLAIEQSGQLDRNNELTLTT
jgi:glutaredoxin 3